MARKAFGWESPKNIKKKELVIYNGYFIIDIF